VTPEYAVGVWAGNADGEGRPELTGIRAAAPILFDLFNILPHTTWFNKPEADLAQIEICERSGHRKGPHCETITITDATAQGRRAASCPYCTTIHLDREGKYRVDSRLTMVTDMTSHSWFVLPPVMEWYYKKHHSDYRTLPEFADAEILGSEEHKHHSVSIIYPNQHGVIYIPLELSGKRGRSLFEAAHRRPLTKIYWHLDDEYLGETFEIHEMAVAPKPGVHLLTLIDEHGEMAQRSFQVLSR
jgi:penicillin-binding protein 1C